MKHMFNETINGEQAVMSSFGVGVLFLVVVLRVEDLINSLVETSPPLCTRNHKNDTLCEQNLPRQHIAEQYGSTIRI